MEAILAKANGSTFQEISKGNFRPSVVVPSEPMLQAFDAVAKPLYERIAKNERETALSPRPAISCCRRVSGELRVAEAETLARGSSMMAVAYHQGRFPPEVLDWPPASAPIGRPMPPSRGMRVLHSIPSPNVLLSPLTTQEAVLSSAAPDRRHAGHHRRGAGVRGRRVSRTTTPRRAISTRC